MSWNFCPVVDGTIAPEWRPSNVSAADAPPANLLQTLLVDWPGDLALVRDPPILLPGTTIRDTDAEHHLFRTETSVLAAYGYAIVLLAFVGTPNPSAIHRAIARTVLQQQAECVSTDAETCEMLAQALADAASQLRADLLRVQWTEARPDGTTHTLGSAGWLDHESRPVENSTPNEKPLSVDGMFGVDAFYATWLERHYRDEGAALARDVRAAARTRWAEYTATPLFAEWGGKFGDISVLVLWLDPAAPVLPARWPIRLCALLWHAVVKPKLDKAAFRHAPAMSLFAERQIQEVRRHRSTQQVGNEIHALSEQGEVVGRFAAPMLDQAALSLLRAGLADLPRLSVERLLRGWSRDVFDQAKRDVNPHNRIVYDGGWQGLAERYGINTDDRARLPRIVEILSVYRGGRRDIPPLVSYWLTPASPKRRAELRLDIGEALAPGFVHRIPKDVKGKERWLLPVLPVPHLFGWRAQHQALVDLQWEMLIVFRERAEAHALGGVELTDADRQAFADRTGLDRSTVDRAIHEWSGDGPDPWLRSEDKRRFVLVDEGAGKLYGEASQIVKNARKGGEANAAKKRRTPKA